MHKFDPKDSHEIMGLFKAQNFWRHVEAIVGQWKSTKPGEATGHMANILVQVAENMRESDLEREDGVVDFKRCEHDVPVHRHVTLGGVKWCPAMKGPCQYSDASEAVGSMLGGHDIE